MLNILANMTADVTAAPWPLQVRKGTEVIHFTTAVHSVRRDLATLHHTIATVQKLLSKESVLRLPFPALWATSVF